MAAPSREEVALKVVNDILQEINFERKVTELYYREDYQDYQIILDDRYHAEIREKLIEAYLENQNKDIKREIVFRIEKAPEFEDWEQQGSSSGSSSAESKDGITVDDSEQYDF